ncbi:5'-nucleotidase [Mactra antiquata]
MKLWLALLVIIYLSDRTINCLDLTILHTNDVHARFEQFNKYGSDCGQSDVDENKCFGGVARRATKIKEIRGSHDNVLLLDAGDQFAGTMFFSVYRGKATSFFMSQLGYDAMCLGNHEFDLGVDPVVDFIDNATFSVLSCNTDVTMEPKLQGKFTKSKTVVMDGETIGLIGFTTKYTARISAPGPTLSFGDEVECIKTEVNALKSQGINKIIALGHSGFLTDQEVAAIDDIDIVVGGHTNTFLYNGAPPSNEKAAGPYPVEIDQPSGGKGLVVQDFMWGKYLGYINLTFDDNGVVTNYAGNPILLDGTTAEDAVILQKVSTWKQPLAEEAAKVVGYTNVVLSDDGDSCVKEECNLGNLITDAIVEYHLSYDHPNTQWAPAAIAFWNGGGIRASLNKGNITNGNIRTVMPFSNVIDLVTLKGKHLREQLEYSAAERGDGGFMQMSGIHVEYNLDMPAGQRVSSVEVRCLACDVPSYSPLQNNKEYKVFISNFILGGGDGYNIKPISLERFNTMDYVTTTAYIQKKSPLATGKEGRIRFVTTQTSDGRRNMISLLHLSIYYVIAYCLMYLIFSTEH